MITTPATLCPETKPEAALWYADQGLPVVPLWWIRDDGACACGAPPERLPDGKKHTEGKHPITKLAPNGFKNATTDPATVRAWWRRYPDANIGTVTGNGLVVVDVDVRNGGDEALHEMLSLHGAFPDTPQALTGGGGMHYWFRAPSDLPADVPGLVDAGVDLLAKEHLLVLPPSDHLKGKPVGRRYEWDVMLNLSTTPLAELPAWVLLEAYYNRQVDMGVGQRQVRKDGTFTPLSQEEIIGIVRGTYPDGTRTEVTNRLVGILRSRGVDSDLAVRFLVKWSETHMTPPKDAEETERHVRTMYRRYGEPEESQWAKGRKFVTWLWYQSIGAHPDGPRDHRREGHAAPQGFHVPPEPATPLTPRDLAQSRTGEWYGLRRMAAGADRPRGELYTPAKGIQLAINAIDVTRALGKDDLADLLALADGQEARSVKAVRQCGWEAGLNCHEHGERARTRVTCKLGAHVTCPTQTTIKVRLAHLPHLEGESFYRSVWLESPIPMPARIENVGWEPFAQATRDAARWVAKASKRKQWKGAILSRAIAFWLDRTTSRLQLRLLLREETRGDTDALIDEAVRQFNAVVVGDKRTQSGETAIIQAMEDSASTLIGMTEVDEVLFIEWWYGTKRERMFQGYAALWESVKARPKEEPMSCDVCGKKLFVTPYDPAAAQMDHQAACVPDHGAGPPSHAPPGPQTAPLLGAGWGV